jgi:hypothetical protein
MASPHHVGGVPDFDEDELRVCFAAQVARVDTAALAFDFGEYNSVQRSWAVRGQGLAANHQFLIHLCQVVPALRFKPTTLIAALTDTCKKHPGVNNTTRSNKDFARAIASSILILCSHARRLRNDKLMKQIMAQCPDHADQTKLKEIRDATAPLPPSTAAASISQPITPPSNIARLSSVNLDEDGWPIEIESDASLGQCSKRPRLDSDGWPVDEGSPEAAPKRHECSNASLLKEARSVAKKVLPRYLPKPKSNKTNAKHDTATISIGEIKLETYSQKSYIRCKGSDAKWHLLVNCNQSQAQNHSDVMRKVFRAAVENDQDKTAMLAFRDSILALQRGNASDEEPSMNSDASSDVPFDALDACWQSYH